MKLSKITSSVIHAVLPKRTKQEIGAAENDRLAVQELDEQSKHPEVRKYYETLWTPINRNNTIKVSPEDHFHRLGLMRELSLEEREKVFEDLRLHYVGFWRSLFPYMGGGIANVTNLAMCSPLHLLKLASNATVPYVPGFVLSPDTKESVKTRVAWLLQRSVQKSVHRREVIVSPFERLSVPKHLEKVFDKHPLFEKLRKVLDVYSEDGVITDKNVKILLEQLQNNPKSLKVEKDAVETFIASFPFLQKLSKKPDTVTVETIESFRQNVKDGIPFLYEFYGQKADKYIEANFVYLGASDTLPERPYLNKTCTNLSNKLNENPTYRKIARWAKENQLSDTQFLPLYSFVDALYGQTSAVVTGLVKEFKLSTVFEQMVALDGVFNGIGFWITKFQILLVGWDKERPDKHRAQYEKELKSLSKEKEALEIKLTDARKRLASTISCSKGNPDEIIQEFERDVLNPLVNQANELTERMENFQHRLNKLLGIENMGFVERMWKKPPQLLNDLKIMVPISIPLTLAYELLYINRYTDYDIDAVSLKFAALVSYMTFLGAISNVILKQIIHLTQDRASLYLDGKKDELMCTRTREVLANFKRTVDKLKGSEEPLIQHVVEELEHVYNTVAKPLIGDETEQASTEKTLNREAKLDFSTQTTEAIRLMIHEIKQHIESLPKGPEHTAAKALRKYLGFLHKACDRAAYIPISGSKFQLKVIADYYRKEILERNLESLLPKHQADFFKNTIAFSLSFLDDLEKKYPKAEQPCELLLLRAKEDHDKLKQLLLGAISLCEPDSSLANSLTQLSSEVEDKQATKNAKRALRAVCRGLKWDLHVLEAKSKTEAIQDLEAYREQRKAYANETSDMNFGPEKIGRYGTQAAMSAKQVGKKLAHIEKYNRWISGIPWIPAHSMLNVAGRIGLTSIVQGMILPFPVMLKVWLMFHIPIRLYIFFTEKFMVDRDLFHRKHAETEKKLEAGVEEYIKQMIAGRTKSSTG